MLDQKIVRTDPESVAKALLKRGYTLDTDAIRQLEEQRKALQIDAESLQAERNSSSKMIGQAKAKGEDITPLLAKVSDFGDRLDAAKEKLVGVQEKLDELLAGIPNIPDAEVPEGTSEDDNVEISRWGDVPTFDFEIRDHVDIGETAGGLDFEAGALLTGSRFVVMRDQFARLHRALVQFMLNTHIDDHGYREIAYTT